MNFLIITIDALSKWYIDHFKKENSFFTYLEENTYNFQNMYSTGPFTEAAVRGYWAGMDPLDGYSYLSESYFGRETFQERFSKTHYMYYGELVPYYNYKLKTDSQNSREKCEERAFEHVWTARLKYYCDLFKRRQLKNEDIWKIELILNQFFDKYSKASDVNKEYEKYKGDKEVYLHDILERGEESDFYLNLKNSLVEACKYPKVICIKNQLKHPLLEAEALFLKKAKNKNIQIVMDNSINTPGALENILSGEKNRCIVSNNDLLYQMRDENERLPKLKEEIEDFLKWYDETGCNLKKSYFAYIHNYDFHYPENFMNARYDNFYAYQKEVNLLCSKLEVLNAKNISVSKQLCLDLLEKNLEFLWNELQIRGVFDNTCVVITADHGISNFMCPIEKSDNRWNYTRTNFNVPMFIKAPKLIEKKDERLICAKHIPQLLYELEEQTANTHILLAEVKDEKYLFTSWINGIPELDRNKIKIGIRNREYSITCEGYFMQLFSSLNINGIYNLKEDPDEMINISYEMAILDDTFYSLYKAMGDEWYKLVSKIISDQNNNYGFYKKYNFFLDDEIYNALNRKSRKISRGEFEKRLAGKKIIIWGIENQGKLFLENLPDTCEIYKVWDSSSDGRSKFYGHRVYLPDVSIDCKNIVFVICDKNEIEIIRFLLQLKRPDFYLFSSVVWEDRK